MTKKMVNTGRGLERRVAQAYREMGAWKVEHDVGLIGHQIDVYVELETPDRGLHRIAVEVKDHTSPVGIKIVSNFSDTVNHLHRARLIDEGIIVSSAGFSRPARNTARTDNIRLLEPADLDAMVAETKAARPITSPHTASSPSYPDTVFNLRSSIGPISVKLLDFELGSITSEQKAIMSRELDRLVKDAVGKRDALVLIKIQEMQKRLNALIPKESFERDFFDLDDMCKSHQGNRANSSFDSPVHQSV